MKRILCSLLLLFFQLSVGLAQQHANIVFIGNSITYGALHQQRELTAPPVLCARWLSQQTGIDTVYFRNCGRSGKTTYHFLPNVADVIPAGDKTYFGDVVAKTAELVKAHPGLPLIFSIKLGTNDAVKRPKNDPTTPEAYVQNMVTIIDSLLKRWPEAHVVLQRPIFNTSDYVTKNGSVAVKKSLKTLNAYYKSFPQIIQRCKAGHVHLGDAEAYNYFEQHWRTDIVEEKDARGKSYWLHPNEKGAKMLGELWGKALLPVLNSVTPYRVEFSHEFGAARKPVVETIAVPNQAGSHYKLGEDAQLRVTARVGGQPLHNVTLHYKVGKEMFLPYGNDAGAWFPSLSV